MHCYRVGRVGVVEGWSGGGGEWWRLEWWRGWVVEGVGGEGLERWRVGEVEVEWRVGVVEVGMVKWWRVGVEG